MAKCGSSAPLSRNVRKNAEHQKEDGSHEAKDFHIKNIRDFGLAIKNINRFWSVLTRFTVAARVVMSEPPAVAGGHFFTGTAPSRRIHLPGRSGVPPHLNFAARSASSQSMTNEKFEMTYGKFLIASLYWDGRASRRI
jgi:hypothetical protein